MTAFDHLSPTILVIQNTSIINLKRISDHEERQTLITSTFVKGWPDVYSFCNRQSILYLDIIENENE